MSIETCYDVLTIGSLAVLVLLALVCLVRASSARAFPTALWPST